MTKRSGQRLHVAKRSLQRYGIRLSAKTQDILAQKIRGQIGRFVVRKTNRITIWDVDYNGQTIRVAYDSKSKGLASVLDGAMV